MQPDHTPPEGSQDQPVSAPRPARDYSQRPQKAIKLKPTIAKEPPSAATRAGPPRAILAVEVAVPVEPSAAPRTPAGPSSPPPPGDLALALAQAAELAGLPPEEWLTRASEALKAQPTHAAAPVSTEEVILFALREMNQRLGALEHRRGMLGWLRRVFSPGR